MIHLSDVKFGFVILHYCSYEDTKICVDSIIKQFDLPDYHIVIVDNASANGTGLILQNEYENQNCHVILNKENLGFARGNNVGYDYLKNEIHCNFICITNNDTYLMTKDFGSKCLEDYMKYKYCVLGPNIFTSDGKRCNPIDRNSLTFEKTTKKLVSLNIQLFLNLFNLDVHIRKMLHRLKNSDKTECFEREKYYENVKVHGSCLVFSPLFVEQYNGLNEGTFLYLEEDFLYIILMKDKMKTIYSPNVKIFHSEDGSTNYLHKGRKKRRFILKNHLMSMRAIRNYLRDYQ